MYLRHLLQQACNLGGYYPIINHGLVCILLFSISITIGVSQEKSISLEHVTTLFDHSHMGTEGGGISTVDFNQDGYQDISLGGNAGEPSRFILNVNGELIDTTLHGIDNVFEVKQLLWVDIDNDNDLDLFISCKAGVSQIYINDGDLTFSNQTIAFQLDISIRNYVGATFLDYDRDGYLDLYIAERPNANLEGINRFRLYRNIKGTTFEEITEECDCSDMNKRPFGSLVMDFNRDLYPDILNAHDRGNGLSLFKNTKGVFSNITSDANVNIEMDAMGMTPSDIDRNGTIDIYITNIEEGNKLLLKDEQNDRYQEAASIWDVEHNVLSWGTLFLDLNNDGIEELYVANSAAGSQYPNVIYTNQNDTYSPMSIEGDTLTNYACAYIDLSNNGMKHLINVGTRGDNTAILINSTPQLNYIDVELVGIESNRFGIGSWIDIYAGDSTFSSYYQNVEGYLSQQPFTQSFGLGTIESIDSIVVTWPTGHCDRLLDKDANQKITIVEGQSNDGSITIDTEIIHHYTQPTLFTEVSDSLNIHHYVRHQGFNGGGCAFFDSDNDGDDDLYLTGGAEQDALYINNGGSFEESGFLSGIALTNNFYTTGVVTGDLNNDGMEDLFVTTHGSSQISRKNLLLFNKGNNEFEDVWPFLDIISTTSAAILIDFNLDGLLDIYTLNYVNEAGFLEDSTGTIIGYDHTCYENHLYQNHGNFQFEDVTDSKLNDALNQACSLAALATDYDQDGDQDILVGNDFGEDIIANTLLQNNNAESLVSAADLGFNDAIFSMGISGADLDNDLDIDYYVTNFGENIFIRNDGESLETLGGLAAGSTYNSLDSTDLSISWGTVAEDFNNDGNTDIYVGNGYVPSPDYLPGRVSDNDRLYLNRDNFDFEELLPANSGIDNLETTRGVACSDFDLDGDIDLAINVMRVPANGNSLSKFYINNTLSTDTSHWVQFRLEGLKSNTSACGARVELYSQDYSTTKEIYCGSSHASSNSKVLHFGLKDHNFIDSLKVFWPNSKRTIDTLFAIEANRLYHIIEDTSAWSIDTMSIDTTMIDTMVIDTTGMDIGGTSVYPQEDDPAIISSIGDNKNDQHSVVVYPNPTTTNSKVKIYASDEIISLKTYGNLGEIKGCRYEPILSNNSGYKSMYLLDLPKIPGVYYIQIVLANKQVSITKLIIH